MSKSGFWGVEQDREAARQLGLSDDHIIVYMNNRPSFLYGRVPVDDLENLEAWGLLDTKQVSVVLREALIDVELPSGWRLVGMIKRDDGPNGECAFGFVDFSALGAA